MRFLIALCIALAGSTGTAGAVPFLEIKDYSARVDFTGKQIALLGKGDDPAYGKREFDDRRWPAVSLPSNWNHVYGDSPGICWYRLHIKMPGVTPDFSPGVKLGVITDVDEVYFNGTLIGRSGRFPPRRISAYDRARLYEIPARLVEPGKDNILAVRIAGLFPYESGPYRGRFEIGPFHALQRDFLVKEFFDVFFVIVYFAVAVYFAVLFASRTMIGENLFFSLFTFSSAVYLLLRTQVKYFITENFLLLKRIEYLFLFVLLLFMMEYITHYFRRRRGALNYAYYLVTAASLVPIIVFDSVIAWNRVLLYLVEPAWIVPLAYCVAVTVRNFRSEEDAKYLLATFPVLWLIFINDVLVDRGILNSIRLANYGFMIVIAGTAMVMRNRFNRLGAEVEALRARKGGKVALTEENGRRVQEVMIYLEENFRSDISREGLAGVLGLHHDYLGKLFRQYTGKRINEYVNELRIAEAVRFLDLGEMNVTDIAFEVGFESLSTFYRVFQSIMNETPSDYQEKKQSLR